MDEPPKKKPQHTTSTSKSYKKKFNAPLSKISHQLPSSGKSVPSKSMVATWWLEEHPDFKTFDGAEWLVGFCHRLTDDELHPTDWDHLKELTMWHEQKQGRDVGDAQPFAGPSRLA